MGLIFILNNSCDEKDNDNINPASITDNDGNVYTSVTIGTQIWMVENLKTTKYSDGTSIPLVTEPTAWGNLTTPAYCWYNNNEATYKATYGALYNWYTINTGKLCPTGWHVPTEAEWTKLTTYLGGTGVAGGKLKETGTAHWSSPNTGATNESGFTALPGGDRTLDGSFNHANSTGRWWSSTENEQFANGLLMIYNWASVDNLDEWKEMGFSVRCLRDN